MTGLTWSVAGKAWTGLAGSAAAFLVPWLLQVATTLPSPWPEVAGAVVAVMTWLGVYHAPYAPVLSTASDVTAVPPLGPAVVKDDTLKPKRRGLP